MHFPGKQMHFLIQLKTVQPITRIVQTWVTVLRPSLQKQAILDTILVPNDTIRYIYVGSKADDMASLI